MFSDITYKKKLIVLFILIALVFLVANKQSFSVTKNAYQQIKELEHKLKYVNSSTQGIDEIQSELAIYDKLIGRQGLKPEEIQQQILNFISKINEIKLINIAEIHQAKENGFHIITNQLIIEGGINELLKTIYAFEKNFAYANIVSIDFKKEREFQTRKLKLRVKIIFQNYEKSL